MLIDLIKKSRSYRSFDPARRVTEGEVRAFIECARFAPCGNNRQLLRFRPVTDAEEMARLVPVTKWAAALPEYHFPPAGHEPTAAIVICHDTALEADSRASARDVGIAAQTMLLAAADAGLGGCMIANFRPEAAADALALPASLIPVLIVMLGKPDEVVVTEDAAGSVKYYRDENNVHHVPKRTMDELIVK